MNQNPMSTKNIRMPSRIAVLDITMASPSSAKNSPASSAKNLLPISRLAMAIRIGIESVPNSATEKRQPRVLVGPKSSKPAQITHFPIGGCTT
jgi:hypothetical protein